MTNSDHSVINGIEDGDFDSILSEIVSAVSLRKEIVADRAARDISIGDEVRFNDTIRPKYLAGKTATVVKINRKTIVVNCPDDPSYKKYRNSKNVRCPNSLIDIRQAA